MDLERAQQWVTNYGPIAVGIGSTFDNTGVPIFFVAGLTVAGILEVPREIMFVAALIGSIAGDLTVFAIGRYYLTKQRILMGPFGRRFAPVLSAGEKAIRKWGLWTIMFGRFIPYLGKVTPLLAGSFGLSWLVASVSVCFGSTLLIGICYLFADTMIDVIAGEASLIQRISLGIGFACLLVLWRLNAILRRQAEAEHAKEAYRDGPKRSRYL